MHLNDLTNINLAVDVVQTSTSDSESKERRMIGDFDGSANEFWKLYRDEAKSHDDARIDTLKEGMDSALIFVRSFSFQVHIRSFIFFPRSQYGLGYADVWLHRLVYFLLLSLHS